MIFIKSENFARTIISISLSVTVAFLFIFLLVRADWTAPTETAPTCSLSNPACNAPINVGATTQTKSGGLNITGNVGIGTTNPLSKLSIGGNGNSAYEIYATGNSYGIVGQGSLAGAFFQDSNGTSYAYLGYGDYGLYTPNKVSAGSLCIGTECTSSLSGLSPRAAVDTNGNWTWTTVVSRFFQNGPGNQKSYWNSFALDANKAVLGIRISGSSDDGGICVAGVTGYFYGGVTNRAYISDLDINGSWTGSGWSNGASAMATGEWIFDNAPFGRNLGNQTYADNIAYNKAAGVTSIPPGKYLTYHQWYYDGGGGGYGNTCNIEVLYQNQ